MNEKMLRGEISKMLNRRKTREEEFEKKKKKGKTWKVHVRKADI